MYSVKVCKFYLPGACPRKSWLFPGASIIISFTPSRSIPPLAWPVAVYQGSAKTAPKLILFQLLVRLVIKEFIKTRALKPVSNELVSL